MVQFGLVSTPPPPNPPHKILVTSLPHLPLDFRTSWRDKDSASRILRVFILSAILCVLFGNPLRAVFSKISQDFSCYGEIFFPIYAGILGTSLDFGRLGQNPAGAKILSVRWSIVNVSHSKYFWTPNSISEWIIAFFMVVLNFAHHSTETLRSVLLHWYYLCLRILRNWNLDFSFWYFDFGHSWEWMG